MWLVILFMLITVVVLFAGVFVMARGGEVNKKYSNKLMVARVVFQALAILSLVVMFAIGKE